jgi:hypothetical protein
MEPPPQGLFTPHFSSRIAREGLEMFTITSHTDKDWGMFCRFFDWIKEKAQKRPNDILSDRLLREYRDVHLLNSMDVPIPQELAGKRYSDIYLILLEAKTRREKTG